MMGREFDAAGLERDLRGKVQGEVRFDKVSRALYSTDASVYQIEPVGVLVPKSQEDIIAAREVCARYRCPITMRGGGTSQAGQAIGEGLQIDCSKYVNRLLEVNPEERWARVEPGIVLDELNALLKQHGLRFAPDISTASRATVGGMIANNSSGARSVLYGKTSDHVLEQKLLLSNGTVTMAKPLTSAQLDAKCIQNDMEGRCYRTVRDVVATHREEIARRFPKVMRRVMGYSLDAFVDESRMFDLSRLIVGSEGTLAIMLEAKIRLVPLPKFKAVLSIEFPDLLDALGATPHILKHGPSAIEVMDRFILDHTKQNANLQRVRESFITGDPGGLLCVEFYTEEKEELRGKLQAVEQDLTSRGIKATYFYALEADEQARIWRIREAALGLSMAMKEDAKSLSFVEDTAVEPERLREYIARFLQIIKKHNTVTGVYAHASVGCLHVRPVVNMKTADGVAKFQAIASDIADLVLEFGGALSGEHGDGFVRGPFIPKMYGHKLYEAFRTIKQAFDPHNLLNPGKIVDCPPLTANLRYGPQYKARRPDVYFDLNGFRGLPEAVEMCSGVGACRKKIEGTMCPSYMATRDEMHSTRGRANVLRLAMSGKLGEAGLHQEGVKEVLDLCLECRACKAECPVSVDMGRYKSEFLAGYYRVHGVPRKAQLLGHVAEIAPLGSRFAPLSNWVAQSAPARWFNEKYAGVDARRKPPTWASKPLRGRVPANASPTVLLFADTFTNFYNPETGLDAIKVLEAGGQKVTLADHVCCGRPLISQGLLDEARVKARENVRRLANQKMPLLFCEPSCLTAMKEDVPALLRGEEQRAAQAIAERCFLWEEWVHKNTTLKLRAGPSKILLHGHCHQKSMGLVAPAKSLLEKIPGATVVDLDAGCCGMAGSFGYAKDHYEVSKAIGERKLLPAARALKAGEVLVAAGISCRHQVEELASAEAKHPARLLAELLEK
ncbi:MAG: FAD-binding protein [Bryobacterales bacterium]|nr:FAD-binding protein [Bryobacterales bacterium]